MMSRGVMKASTSVPVRRANAASTSRAARVVTAAAAEEKDIYPEWGASPYAGNWVDIPWYNWAKDKSEEEIATLAGQEVLHGRWAMLGVAGAWSAEQGTGIPWFQAGAICTPADCTAVNSIFPGQVLALAPEGSGYPSFTNVFFWTLILMGLAEFYRGGVIPPAFKEYAVGDVHPGGRFDPLGLSTKLDLEKMKVAEIKHGRLAMFSWGGYMAQAFATNDISDGKLPHEVSGAVGPYANWLAHVSDPLGNNIWTQ